MPHLGAAFLRTSEFALMAARAGPGSIHPYARVEVDNHFSVDDLLGRGSAEDFL